MPAKKKSDKPDKSTLGRYKKPVINVMAAFFIIAAAVAATMLGEDWYNKTSVTKKSVSPEGNMLATEDWWRWMPGSRWQNGTLQVQPVNFAIVNQDGTGGSPNFPVNLYGVYAQTSGDFGISVAMQSLSPDPAYLQFYGEVPVIADEFRIERKSVRLTVQKELLVAEIWDGSSQSAAVKQEFAISAAQKHDIALDRQGEYLILTVDGRQVGTIQERGVFTNGQVWFGLGAQVSPWELAYLRLHQKGRGSVQLVSPPSQKVSRPATDGMQAAASNKRPGFLVGSAVALGPAVSDDNYFKTMFGGEFGILTPENELKMINTQPDKGVYDFKKADALVDLAKKHKVGVHGHALVFGEANPPWFNKLDATTPSGKDEIKTVMLDHINTVVAHYKGTIKSWDVINEPLMDDTQAKQNNGRTGLRPHKWHQAMGPDYIPMALAAAHKADPSAQLYINDYGLEQNGERWNAFFTFMRQLKPKLQAQGVPIKNIGVGFQAHEYERRDRIDPEDLRNHIQALADLGFTVRISEMDVDLQEGQPAAAREYAAVAGTCINLSSCTGWGTWMPTSAYNYYMNRRGEIKKGPEGMFDDTMRPTSSIAEVKNVFK